MFQTNACLIKRLRKELTEAYREGKKIGYKATEMLDAVTEKNDVLFKSIITKFVTADTIPSGFTTLWKKKRLDLSIEYIIAVKDKGKYNKLFDDTVIAICKQRLAEYQNKK